MKKYHYPLIIAGYKIVISFVRFFLGLMIILLGYNLKLGIDSLFNHPHEHTRTLFYYLSYHIIQAPEVLTAILAFSLITISLLEIVFGAGIILRKRWGAIGIFWTCLAWVPVEILFISKFWLIPKFLGFVIDILILVALFHLLTKSRDYFKKE